MKVRVKHGQAGKNRTPTYRSWEAMKRRCSNPNAVNYDHYGGKGITVCPQWVKSFEAFLVDMGNRPQGKTLDRIDSTGHYTPDNCRWADNKRQNRNRDI